MNIVLKDNNKEFLEIFKNAIAEEYQNIPSFQKVEIILKKNKKLILIKITAQSSSKLKGISSTLNRLWSLSKKIYYGI